MYKYDLTGNKFGKLTALYPVPDKSHRARWHCICECGKEKDVLQQNLSNGHVRSCGCYHAEVNRSKITAYNSSIGRESHKETHSRLYRIWIGIKSRCSCETASSYKNYGGRGISISSEWANSYATFKEWSLKHGYSETLTIDRINVNGDYCPDNCRWVPMSIQEHNKRISALNTSGTIGVSYNKKAKKWVAYITKDKMRIHLGSFSCIDDAIKARNEAESQYYG